MCFLSVWSIFHATVDTMVSVCLSSHCHYIMYLEQGSMQQQKQFLSSTFPSRVNKLLYLSFHLSSALRLFITLFIFMEKFKILIRLGTLYTIPLALCFISSVLTRNILQKLWMNKVAWIFYQIRKKNLLCNWPESALGKFK